MRPRLTGSTTHRMERGTMNCQRLLQTLIIFQLAVCPLTIWMLSAAAAQAQTSRTATANSYIERGAAWFAKGEWERAICPTTA